MIQTVNLIAILLMASATFMTRALGYVALSNRELPPRVKAMLEAAPGCVLISVIAPHFVASNLADIAAMAITLLLAIRLPMAAAVMLSIAAAAGLRYMLG